MPVTVDTRKLEQKVQLMYRAVATEPHGEHHFEYKFISERARDASAQYGVESVSLVARKER